MLPWRSCSMLWCQLLWSSGCWGCFATAARNYLHLKMSALQTDSSWQVLPCSSAGYRTGASWGTKQIESQEFQLQLCAALSLAALQPSTKQSQDGPPGSGNIMSGLPPSSPFPFPHQHEQIAPSSRACAGWLQSIPCTQGLWYISSTQPSLEHRH